MKVHLEVPPIKEQDRALPEYGTGTAVILLVLSIGYVDDVEKNMNVIAGGG